MEQFRGGRVDADKQIKSFEQLTTARKIKGVEFLIAFAYCANEGVPIKADVVLGVLERVNLRKSDLSSVTSSYIIGASNQLRKIGVRPTDAEKEAVLYQVEEYISVFQSVLHKLYPAAPKG